MAEKGFVDIDGFRLRYNSVGKGPTALVTGSSVYYPRSFSKELTQHFRMVFADWRGFAEDLSSGNSENRSQLSLDTLLDDIERIRQKLGVDSCIIMGHSAHALLALEYAKKYPQHVSHVVMIGISPNFSPQMAAAAERNWEESVWPERKQALAERIRQFSDDELAKLPPSQRFIAWNVRRCPQTWYDINFDSSWLWEGISPNMPVLDYLYGTALRDLDITRGLEALNKPVFLALGRYDFILAPPSSWDPIRPKFRDLTVRVFEHSGHSPHYEEPHLFNQQLLDWLQRHP